MMKRHKISDEQWDRIKDLTLPERSGRKERPVKNYWMMINATIWILKQDGPTFGRKLFSQTENNRRIVTRFEKNLTNSYCMIHLACILICMTFCKHPLVHGSHGSSYLKSLQDSPVISLNTLLK